MSNQEQMFIQPPSRKARGYTHDPAPLPRKPQASSPSLPFLSVGIPGDLKEGGVGTDIFKVFELYKSFFHYCCYCTNNSSGKVSITTLPEFLTRWVAWSRGNGTPDSLVQLAEKLLKMDELSFFNDKNDAQNWLSCVANFKTLLQEIMFSNEVLVERLLDPLDWPETYTLGLQTPTFSAVNPFVEKWMAIFYLTSALAEIAHDKKYPQDFFDQFALMLLNSGWEYSLFCVFFAYGKKSFATYGHGILIRRWVGEGKKILSLSWKCDSYVSGVLGSKDWSTWYTSERGVAWVELLLLKETGVPAKLYFSVGPANVLSGCSHGSFCCVELDLESSKSVAYALQATQDRYVPSGSDGQFEAVFVKRYLEDPYCIRKNPRFILMPVATDKAISGMAEEAYPPERAPCYSVHIVTIVPLRRNSLKQLLQLATGTDEADVVAFLNVAKALVDANGKTWVEEKSIVNAPIGSGSHGEEKV